MSLKHCMSEMQLFCIEIESGLAEEVRYPRKKRIYKVFRSETSKSVRHQEETVMKKSTAPRSRLALSIYEKLLAAVLVLCAAMLTSLTIMLSPLELVTLTSTVWVPKPEAFWK